MSEEQEQRVCTKFCVKLGRNGAQTFEMLRTAFGEQCLSCACIFEWHKRFKEGWDSVDDNPRSGRPTTSKTDDCVVRVRELIGANWRLTIRELSVEVGVSYGTCHAILTQDLNMWHVAAKFVLRILCACLWQQTCCRKQSQMKTLWGKSSWATRPGDETSVFAVKVCWFPEAKESAPHKTYTLTKGEPTWKQLINSTYMKHCKRHSVNW